MPAPYLPDTPEVLTTAHRQIVRARATHPTFPAPIDLPFTELRISWDEERTPRVTAQVEIPAATPGAERLDALAGARIEIDAGYGRRDGRDDVHPLADLGLRQTVHSRPDDSITLLAAGDESLVIDASPAVAGTITAGTHADMIRTLLKQAISPAPRSLVTITGGSVTIDPLNDRWDTIEDIADRLGADVYDRGDRTFVIAARPELAEWPAMELRSGPGGTLTEASYSVTRDQWANYVLLINRWRNEETDTDHEIRATAYVDVGPYSISGPAGRRIEPVQRAVPTTQAAANAAAASILRRTLSRSTRRTVTGIAAWWIRPGDTVTIDGHPELVSSIEFTASDGIMQITTRRPVGPIEIATSTPPAAPPQPDPEPPARQTYISEWPASDSATYYGNGDRRTSPDLVQGTAPDAPQNGNHRSIVLFAGANSTGDETGRSITTALGPGAQITKAELGFHVAHTYWGSGGVARIGAYGGSTIPATFAGGSPYHTTPTLARSSWVWVNITNPSLLASLQAGTVRGITFGPGLTADHYIRIAPHNAAAAQRPRLRLTYSR